MDLSDKKVTLSVSGIDDAIELPVYSGTLGADVIDIRNLYGQAGLFTYDPGFLATASTESSITYIDGNKGELLYRGYPIEQLAQNCNFPDICYLLLNGELPNETEKQDFEGLINN